MTELEWLLDYRRRVAQMYREARLGGAGEAAHRRFVRAREALFASHPQSPLPPERRAAFGGLRYFPHDPALRFAARLEPAEGETLEVSLHDDGPVRLRRFGRVRLEVGGAPVALSVYWIDTYGGGLFLPFRDATAPGLTYGGGRYLLDTIKHADLGHDGDRLVVDFNYAYNPSCAYDPRWDCPLAPPENRIDVPIRAGELAFLDGPDA
jgi:uncharacterized protein (DUF1684 family)